MNFFRKLSYFQLKRIRRVLFAVNAGIVASIALFHSPAYILCSMLVTYSVAIFSDRLKIYVMAAHTHEITSRCTWLLDQGNVPERAKTLSLLPQNRQRHACFQIISHAGRSPLSFFSVRSAWRLRFWRFSQSLLRYFSQTFFLEPTFFGKLSPFSIFFDYVTPAIAGWSVC